MVVFHVFWIVQMVPNRAKHHDIIDYGLTVALQRKCFILKSAKGCPHWLKTKLWKALGHLPRDIVLLFKKTFFIICQTLGFYFRYESNWSQTLWSKL